MEFVIAVIIVLVTLLFNRWVTVIVGALAGFLILSFSWGLFIGFVLWGIRIAVNQENK